MEKHSYEKTVVRVGIITIIGNLILTLIKVIVGLLAKSKSLVSDGIHSASDVFSTIIVMIGAKMSAKEADKDHPFGHERLESVASMILAMMLGATALILGYSGTISIIDYINGERIHKNGLIYVALISAILSIVIKFFMYLYTIIVAKKIKSTSLKADAYHHLSDSLSSIGSVLGIIGLMIGGAWSILDPVASIIICLFILKVAFDIARDATNQMVDKSAPEAFETELKDFVNCFNGVKRINSLKTRQFGNKVYIEFEIAVDGNLTVTEGHEIAETIHDLLEARYDNIKHIMIHIDPYKEESTE